MTTSCFGIQNLDVACSLLDPPAGRKRECGSLCESQGSTNNHGAYTLNAAGLPTVNGDVLYQIAAYLYTRDALNLSLTARRIHDFVIHRVEARLVCRTSADLRRIHHHLLHDSVKRVVSLRSLTVVATTFVERSWQDDPNWIFPQTTFEYSLAPLLGDILEAAPGLTHLSLEHCGPLLQHDSRIAAAIASMTRLANLQLRDADSATIIVFQTLCSRPTHIHVSTVKCCTPSDAKQLLDFIYELLAAVSSIKELRVLDMDLSKINCRPFKVPLEPRANTTTLPYVRRLSVHWSSQLIDLAALFPNLDILEQHVSSYHFDKHSGRPLRRLSIPELRTTGTPHHPVHLLHLRRYPRDLEAFLRTVSETSPVGLALHGFVDTASWIQTWERLPQVAPRLRFLDVGCHMWERSPQSGWVAKFVDSLRQYSLVCIRVVAPAPPLPGSGEPRWSAEDVQMLAELPERLMDVMESVRYIAWAARCGVSDYEWYEDGYDCAHAEYKWYQVVKQNGQRVLRTLSASGGERVRQFLLESDMDTIIDIDNNLVVTNVVEPMAVSMY